MIQFRFPAPLDNYAGEVTAAKGEFALAEDLMVDGARGFIEIDLRTFNIEGADGPAPARHMLLLDLNFVLKEKRTSS